jgi:hypothetical protein
MPPCLDVHVLTGERNRAMIERFVREFTSSDLHAPHPCDLMVAPADYDGRSGLSHDSDFDVVHVDTLDAAIRYGLAEPRRAFWLYFSSTPPWRRAWMAFTLSGELAFGVSVDDPYGEPQPLEDAREVMARLTGMTGARHAWVGYEEPPTLDPDRDEPWRESLA